MGTNITAEGSSQPRLTVSGLGHSERMKSDCPSYDVPQLFYDDTEHIALIFGGKINRRLAYIQSEFGGMTRCCTTKLDGMAMATQWV